MIRVLFICLGNICRSPMAEAVFRDLVIKENLEGKIEVDSGGTGHWHVGNVPHEGTRALLDQNKIDYQGITARQVKESDWEEFDYLIAMDDQNIEDLNRIQIGNDTVVAKLMDFVDEPETKNVPDPYYTGNFDYTYQLVSEGSKKLLMYIRNKHNI
ncbi:low molecular weight phosphotyrosine protein phosphatase [Ornithinibacillus sp. L9]|uniref:protein-tyrosine-phosphatase n=1 Tax=Ornithinibacillus caprae TaxID=2678566 RepID=A0A6N8FI40_9BACI|nr:low molecular weight protein-tyrosine-phosphatase [Ornithinibacillus caprae]MUK88356.1 low molecular weight phosphotyrosine protein phosphatase [Ornithinibacillus caprae]